MFDMHQSIYSILLGLKIYFPMDSLPLMAKIGSLSGSSGGAASPSIVPGKYGSALSFDGIDDIIDVGNLRSTCFGNLNNCPNGHTMAFWLKVYSMPVASNRFIYSGGGQSSNSYGPALSKNSADELCAWYSGNGVRWAACVPLSLGQFVHVVVIWSASDGLKLYMNKILVAHTTTTIAHGTEPSTFNNFYFGRPNTNSLTDKYCKFHIDSFLFWEDVISQDMINRIGEQ